ncbi:hypothetical protein C2E31_14475 [Rhodopirellula baltica]|nr:hypothetical protein C2E31_14475 [Rhodopirellula baltica]
MTDRQGPKHIRVFIASPGDLDEERIVFREVCEKLNNGFGDGIGVEFIADGWENVPSQVGRRNQSVINEKVDQCDVFFLVIHRRWGQDSSDSEYTSYTEEELHRALNRRNEKGRPEIYVFFKNVDPGQLDDPGPQLQKVLAFRNELEATRKALYRTFSDSTEFENEVDYHLRDVARRVVSTRENMPQISAGERAQVPDGKPIEVPAAQLEEPRQKESSITKNKLRVFLSYSHRDLKELNRLKVHLANYKHNDVIEIWHDRQIKAGSEWEAEILQELEKADIILLLVSPDFIASDFCRLTETKHALQRHQKGAALVIPISLKLVAEFPQEISGLQRVPGGDKPITKYRTHADGYVKAVQLIMELSNHSPKSNQSCVLRVTRESTVALDIEEQLK